MSEYKCNTPRSTAKIISKISLVEINFYTVILPYEWAKSETLPTCTCLQMNLTIHALVKKK